MPDPLADLNARLKRLLEQTLKETDPAKYDDLGAEIWRVRLHSAHNPKDLQFRINWFLSPNPFISNLLIFFHLQAFAIFAHVVLCGPVRSCFERLGRVWAEIPTLERLTKPYFTYGEGNPKKWNGDRGRAAHEGNFMRIRRWEGAAHWNHGDLCSPRFRGLGKNLGVHSHG
jgi:hypothetical protein